MRNYDWPGRPDGVWLHSQCEAPWFDLESPSAGRAARAQCEEAAKTAMGKRDATLPGDRRREAIRASNWEAQQRFDAELKERSRQH